MTLLTSWLFWVLFLFSLAVLGFFFWFMAIVSRIILNVLLSIPISAEPFRNEEGILQYSVNLKTRDGVSIKGFFIPAKESKGRTVVFCHEIGAGAASYQKYAQFLLEKEFNVFTFDFRGHGLSGNLKHYVPRQWVTHLEVEDLRAALDHLKTRRDIDPDRIALFGISKGAGTALACAARRKEVQAVISDGGFSTAFTINDFMRKWTSIYLPVETLPASIYWFLRVWSLAVLNRRIKCRFPSVDKAVASMKKTALLFINGEKDGYISYQQAQRLYAVANTPNKELWIVPEARHNEAAVVASREYQERIVAFLEKHL